MCPSSIGHAHGNGDKTCWMCSSHLKAPERNPFSFCSVSWLFFFFYIFSPANVIIIRANWCAFVYCLCAACVERVSFCNLVRTDVTRIQMEIWISNSIITLFFFNKFCFHSATTGQLSCELWHLNDSIFFVNSNNNIGKKTSQFSRVTATLYWYEAFTIPACTSRSLLTFDLVGEKNKWN